LLQAIEHIEVKYNCVYKLSDEERAAVRRGLLEISCGQLSSEKETAAVFDRYRAPPD
jgi:predicted transcriptional regulator